MLDEIAKRKMIKKHQLNSYSSIQLILELLRRYETPILAFITGIIIGLSFVFRFQ